MDRTNHIGGSDWTDILELDGYGCRRRAWLNKREPLPIEMTGHIRRGNRLEEVAAEEYTSRTGRALRRVNLPLEHRECSWWRGHVDRRTLKDSDIGIAPVELKCPSVMSYRKARRKGIRMGYIAQATHYGVLMGADTASFGLFSAELWEVAVLDVPVDHSMVSMMRDEGERFWALVENGPAPDALDPKDRRCARCQYRQRCHGEEALPEFDGEISHDDSPELIALLDARSELVEIRNEAEDGIEEVNEKLKSAIGARSVVQSAGYRVYHTAQERRSIDSKKLRADLPQIAQKYEKVSKFTTLRVYERKA